MASIIFLLVSHDVFRVRVIALMHPCKYNGVLVKWDKKFSVSRIRRLTAIIFSAALESPITFQIIICVLV